MGCKELMFILVKGRWCFVAGNVSSGLVESNGSLLPGLRLACPAWRLEPAPTQQSHQISTTCNGMARLSWPCTMLTSSAAGSFRSSQPGRRWTSRVPRWPWGSPWGSRRGRSACRSGWCTAGSVRRSSVGVLPSTPLRSYSIQAITAQLC